MPNQAFSADSLLRFFYRMPVALVQSTEAGLIEMITPMASQLLMPLATQGRLDNLFDVLEPAWPRLRQDIAHYMPSRSVSLDPLQACLQVEGSTDGPRSLQVDIHKNSAHQLIAVITDTTLAEQRVRHAWQAQRAATSAHGPAADQQLGPDALAPLNTIAASARALLDDPRDRLTEHQREHLCIISDAARCLLDQARAEGKAVMHRPA